MAIFLVLQALIMCGAVWLLSRSVMARIKPSSLDNIPGPRSDSFWTGNLKRLFDRHGWKFLHEVSENYDQVVRLDGMFGAKHLYIADPLALHHIMLKDHHAYEESSYLLKSNTIIFGTCLLSTQGLLHRRQRKMLMPVFSIAHMRNMVPLFYRVTDNLRKALTTEVGDEVCEIDILSWMGRTALELIGQAGLGYSFDPLVDNVPNAYGDALKELLPTLLDLEFLRRLVPNIPELGSSKLRRRIVESIPLKSLRKLISIIDVMDSTSTKIFYAKKKAIEQGDEAVINQLSKGKDIMSILLKANMTASEEDKLPDYELLGQMSALTFAATDTTSSALARTLHLISQHPDIQEKLRAEIVHAKSHHDLSYDELVALPFLDAVCRETLRLWPPVNIIFREALQDTILPLSEPICGIDGSRLPELVVPKDTGIFISIYAVNRSKAIWGEDANEFRPERWLEPLPDTVLNAKVPGVYSHLLTFAGGGRSCIGFKFSQLEMKAVLVMLVENFTFSLPEQEIVWNIAGVNYPTIGKRSGKPQLPLKIAMIK